MAVARERHGLPVGQLQDLGRETGGLSVFPQGVVERARGGEVVPRRRVVVGALELDEAAELFERLRMVFDPEVEDSVGPRAPRGLPLHDHDGGRLHAADVAAHRLGRVERREHPLGQVTLGFAVGLGHGGPHLVVPHEVRLHGELVPHLVPRGGDALGPRVGGHLALRVHHGDLADLSAGVRRQETGEGFGGAPARPHQVEAERPVGGVHEGLGGNGAHARLGPRDGRAHGEPVGLDGHAHVPRGGISRHDRVGECPRRGGEEREGEERGECEDDAGAGPHGRPPSKRGGSPKPAGPPDCPIRQTLPVRRRRPTDGTARNPPWGAGLPGGRIGTDDAS